MVRNHEKSMSNTKQLALSMQWGFKVIILRKKIGIETGVYPVKHQAFITRRLPMMGINGIPLPMIIDRRQYKGFIAVYGQQLGETGQIIGCASPHIEPYETDKTLKSIQKIFWKLFQRCLLIGSRNYHQWVSGSMGWLLCRTTNDT